ncbi:unnamed protein product [Protopolystoma xenopodis]|uniref:Uncharacterized protein n=1 Tax=Protopolystoma xenopodis TaxID=117903 RepID=A0A448XDC7_9PLAT|nr:unnamed protein product [Protopolystoma xenopodis]
MRRLGFAEPSPGQATDPLQLGESERNVIYPRLYVRVAGKRGLQAAGALVVCCKRQKVVDTLRRLVTASSGTEENATLHYSVDITSSIAR